jgi:hypothetical protein
LVGQCGPNTIPLEVKIGFDVFIGGMIAGAIIGADGPILGSVAFAEDTGVAATATGATGNIEGVVSVGARVEARNLSEQLTLSEARAGAGERIMQGNMRDPRFPADTWGKFQHVHTTPEGESIVIHYWERLVDGLRTGFKFKD